MIKWLVIETSSLCFGYGRVSSEIPGALEASRAQDAQTFYTWLSAYFQPTANDRIASREELQKSPMLTSPCPTISKLSADEACAMLEPAALVSSRGARILETSHGVLEQNFRRTFLDGVSVLPNVDVVLLCGTHTLWQCKWAIRCVEDLLKEPPVGERRRSVSFVTLQGGNHFVSCLCAFKKKL